VPITDLIPQYYAGVGGGFREEFKPGQLYWAPTFYLPPHSDVLFQIEQDPTESKLKFEIRRATAQSFSGAHRPLKSIGLEATEELVAVKAKRRIVVLLSEANTVHEDIRPYVSKQSKIQERSFVCLPLYGVHADETRRGFPSIVVERIKALMYNQFFYFPPSSNEDNPVVYEAIGRLDRLQVFHRDTLGASAVALRLHEDCLFVLREWVRGYLTDHYSKDMDDLRKELTKELYT
jgi:hypothetical protein